jgi:hypothetical protein
MFEARYNFIVENKEFWVLLINGESFWVWYLVSHIKWRNCIEGLCRQIPA